MDVGLWTLDFGRWTLDEWTKVVRCGANSGNVLKLCGRGHWKSSTINGVVTIFFDRMNKINRISRLRRHRRIAIFGRESPHIFDRSKSAKPTYPVHPVHPVKKMPLN